MIHFVDKEGKTLDLDYDNELASGFTLKASEQAIAYPHKIVTVSTGIYLKIDEKKCDKQTLTSLVVKISKSLALKDDLSLAVSPWDVRVEDGVEIKVPLRGGSKTRVINVGEVIGYLVGEQVIKFPSIEEPKETKTKPNPKSKTKGKSKSPKKTKK